MTATEVYYDPWDYTIDADPYPVWRRLRDEQPLYYNEQHDFYALSRFDDVLAASTDWRRYSSARGTVLEIIAAHQETADAPAAGGLIDAEQHGNFDMMIFM